MSWKPSPSESNADFTGYKIYRGEGQSDTFYTAIADLPSGTLEYSDISAKRGISYFYYITAYNDGSNNHALSNPPGPLESNRAYTQALYPAYLQRAQGRSLEDIRVVPNPYNISAQSIQYGTGIDQDKIMFFNIPSRCTIRIYTERGDLVDTIEHTNGSGDQAWYSISRTRQIVVSGLYIAYIEVNEDIYDSETNELLFEKGDSIFKKFIIIR